MIQFAEANDLVHVAGVRPCAHYALQQARAKRRDATGWSWVRHFCLSLCLLPY
jgi:hypothetical protein